MWGVWLSFVIQFSLLVVVDRNKRCRQYDGKLINAPDHHFSFSSLQFQLLLSYIFFNYALFTLVHSLFLPLPFAPFSSCWLISREPQNSVWHMVLMHHMRFDHMCWCVALLEFINIERSLNSRIYPRPKWIPAIQKGKSWYFSLFTVCIVWIFLFFIHLLFTFYFVCQSLFLTFCNINDESCCVAKSGSIRCYRPDIQIMFDRLVVHGDR